MSLGDEAHLAGAIAGALLFLVIAIFSIVVVVKIFQLARRWLVWTARNSTGAPAVILISLAVAAWLFPNPLVFLLGAAWQVITAFLSYLPSQLQQQLVFFQSSCTSLSCLNVMVINLSNSWIQLVSNVTSRVNFANFPIVDAVLFTAIWLGLTHLFSHSKALVEIGNGVRGFLEQLRDGLASVRHVTWLNVCFFVLLIISGYLCLTSIIAIPSLQETISEQVNSNDLRTRLTAVILKDNEFNDRFPVELSPENRLEKSESYQAIIVLSKDADVTPGLATFGKELGRRLDNPQRWFRELRETFRRDQVSAVDLSAKIFELSNKDRKGRRETQQHQLDIELWFHRWWEQRASQLTYCKSNIERLGSNITSQFEMIVAYTVPRTALPSSTPRGAGAFALPAEYLAELSKRTGQAESDAIDSCTRFAEPLNVPAREDFGGYLGVFGVAARWLLKTESLPLILITGLLGFGLLGAACSSVIRNVRKRARGEPLVPDLAGVVIRGTSAAILVFLAVFGGLAVFTGKEANPNPYVVLFTCLMAAVFSENAWAWGAQQFRTRFSAHAQKRAKGRR